MKKKIDSLSAAKGGPTVEEVKPHQEEATPAEPVKEEAPKEEAAKPEAPTTPPPTETPPAADGQPPADAKDSFEALFPEPRVAMGAPPTWLWWILLLIVSAVLGVVGYALAQRNLKGWLSTETTPIPSVSASASPSNSASPTPTATVTPTPTASATFDPATVTMRVLNGTTTTGAAAKAKTTLEAAGFKVRTTGNAQNQNYGTTTVYYQTGRQSEAEAVKAALNGYSVTLTESSLAAPDMVLVVIGLK